MRNWNAMTMETRAMQIETFVNEFLLIGIIERIMHDRTTNIFNILRHLRYKCISYLIYVISKFNERNTNNLSIILVMWSDSTNKTELNFSIEL